VYWIRSFKASSLALVILPSLAMIEAMELISLITAPWALLQIGI